MYDPAYVRMTDDEVQDLLGEAWRVQFASLNRDGTVHVVPLSFFLDDRRITVWTPRRTRKITNLRRDPTVTCLVELGIEFAEFRGAQIYGRAEVIDDPEKSRRAGETLLTRYGDNPKAEPTASQMPALIEERVVVVVHPERVVSWDHRKLFAGQASR